MGGRTDVWSDKQRGERRRAGERRKSPSDASGFAFCLSALNAAFEKTVDFLAVHKILVKLVEAFGFS